MLAGHGIICWADNAKGCYEHTIGLIADAARFLNDRQSGKPAFGGMVVPPSPGRAAIAADLMPRLRGLMTGERRKVGHFSDDAETLEFVVPRISSVWPRLAPRVRTTSCAPRSRRWRSIPPGCGTMPIWRRE